MTNYLEKRQTKKKTQNVQPITWKRGNTTVSAVQAAGDLAAGCAFRSYTLKKAELCPGSFRGPSKQTG